MENWGLNESLSPPSLKLRRVNRRLLNNHIKKLANHTLTIKLPGFVETILAVPVLIYRRLRYGYAFRRIALSRGMYALVEQRDYESLMKYNWHLQDGSRGTFYAVRNVKLANKVGRDWMHRVVMADELRKYPGKVKMVVDHINHNGLDNRRTNLRVVTSRQNTWNSSKGMRGSSKYKGVAWDKRAKKWRVVMCVDYKRINLGYYDDEEEAARAYDRAAQEHKGEFAMLNFP